eukprot:gnl/TRDRNA2_/TRDRNA2_82508_c0_seq1.p1 gnl/TRDRNA2_/TRDRNA2_82508_c0~~gnl/TRDRNA2_/TRDRNA2_82508_c0_seq1.p1  ORF type:complete len:195 (+),score=30.41 gnl/TRDRNA2_/TRDRNA2_82508_c0_seq1:89-673(+)
MLALGDPLIIPSRARCSGKVLALLSSLTGLLFYTLCSQVGGGGQNLVITEPAVTTVWSYMQPAQHVQPSQRLMGAWQTAKNWQSMQPARPRSVYPMLSLRASAEEASTEEVPIRQVPQIYQAAVEDVVDNIQVVKGAPAPSLPHKEAADSKATKGSQLPNIDTNALGDAAKQAQDFFGGLRKNIGDEPWPMTNI